MTSWRRIRSVIDEWRSSTSSIARGTAAVGAGTLVGQAAMILAAPVLARLYDPDAFGALATYSALLMILAAGSTLRYDMVIPIARGDDESTHALVLSLAIGLATSVVTLSVVLVAGDTLASWLGIGGQVQALWLLPAGLLASAVGTSLSGFAVHHRTFLAMARVKVYAGLASVACQLALGVLHGGTAGLVVGDVSGRTISVALLYRALRSRISWARITMSGIQSVARRYWGFARVMTLASVIGALSLQVPFLTLPLLFDLAATGQYFMAYRMLVLPVSLIAGAVRQVFFGEAAHRQDRPEALHDLAKRSASVLFIVAIPTYAITAVAGPQLFVVLLGDQWQEAGEMARLMSPWLLVWSVTSPLSTLLLVGRREKEGLFFTTAELLARVVAIGAGAAVGSLTGAIVALSAVSLVISIVALWRILRVASVRLRDLAAPVATTALVTLPIVLAFGMVLALLPDAPGILIVALAALAWLGAVAASSWRSAELRALIFESDD